MKLNFESNGNELHTPAVACVDGVVSSSSGGSGGGGGADGKTKITEVNSLTATAIHDVLHALCEISTQYVRCVDLRQRDRFEGR